ncbi:MAG: hypothetical protein AB7P20_14640 [Rhizobiaceae bacterium]
MSQFRRSAIKAQGSRSAYSASAQTKRGVESLAFLAAFSFTAALVLGVFH